MRKALFVLLAVLIPGMVSFAQMAPGPQAGGDASDFDNGMEKLFGATPVFSATMITQMNSPNGLMTVKSKYFFDHENSRTEVNLADAQSTNMPSEVISQMQAELSRMQAIGMDKLVEVTASDKKSIVLVYPKLRSYVSMPMPGANQDEIAQTTKLGEETVDGHPCVKNKFVVTVKGVPHEFTAWNATDLNNFPIRIAFDQQGTSATISFQNVSFDKIAASQFQPPAGYSGYPTIPDLMRAAIAAHPGAMPGAPVPAAP